MAFTNIELAQVQQELNPLLESLRPPVELRSEIDYECEVDGRNSSVTIIEVRPYFRDESIKTREPIAKARYIKLHNEWTIFWLRGSNDKWDKYPETPTVASLQEFFTTVKEDKLNCFFG